MKEVEYLRVEDPAYCGTTLSWAEDRARTGHPQLGRLTLYQMSYFRLLFIIQRTDFQIESPNRTPNELIRLILLFIIQRTDFQIESPNRAPNELIRLILLFIIQRTNFISNFSSKPALSL